MFETSQLCAKKTTPTRLKMLSTKCTDKSYISNISV